MIQHALGAIARAKGMSKVAKASGLSRENLYRALSPSHTASLDTVIRVVGALGLGLRFGKQSKSASRAPGTKAAVGSIVGSGKTMRVGRTAHKSAD